MDPSTDLLEEKGLLCTSYDEEVSDGSFKTRNEPPDEIQRPVITDRGSDSYFPTTVRMITCLHGELGKDPFDDAQEDDGLQRYGTLLVFEHRLHALKPGHSFTWVRTTFTFEDAAPVEGEPSSSPSVIAYGPFWQPQRTDETTAEVKKTKGFGANFGLAGGLPVTIGISAEATSEESHIQQHFQKGIAGIRFNNKTRRDDSVWWTLTQNSSQNFGIKEVFRVAILIERKSLTDFVGKFKLELEGSFRYNLHVTGGQIDRFFRRLTLDDPINFSPTKKPRQGKTKGLDSTALGSLITEDGGLSLPAHFRLDPFVPESQ